MLSYLFRARHLLLNTSLILSQRLHLWSPQFHNSHCAVFWITPITMSCDANGEMFLLTASRAHYFSFLFFYTWCTCVILQEAHCKGSSYSVVELHFDTRPLVLFYLVSAPSSLIIKVPVWFLETLYSYSARHKVCTNPFTMFHKLNLVLKYNIIIHIILLQVAHHRNIMYNMYVKLLLWRHLSNQ